MKLDLTHVSLFCDTETTSTNNSPYHYTTSRALRYCKQESSEEDTAGDTLLGQEACVSGILRWCRDILLMVWTAICAFKKYRATRDLHGRVMV